MSAVIKAMKRLREFIFVPALRRYNYPDGTRVPRYPSPGSEPTNEANNAIDYRTAYRESLHNIRYQEPEEMLRKWCFHADPLTQTPEQKLVAYKFLAPNKINDAQAVAEARAQYEKAVGESVDVRVHHDDFNLNTKLPRTREAISEHIQAQFAAIRQVNKSEAWLNDVNDLHNPELWVYQTYDMTGDDPVYRQLTLDIELEIDTLLKTRREAGRMNVFRGDPKFWRILDDSFGDDNIQRVQAQVGETNLVRYREYQESHDDYIPLPIQTQKY